MFSIRRGTFETNSSSTHSISIYTDAEWKERKKLEGNPNYLLDYNDNYVTIDDVIESLLKSDWNDDKENGKKLQEFMKGRELKDCLDEEFEEYDSLEEFLRENEYKSESYSEDYDSYLEEDYTKYTTPGGEVLHIVCKYGRDG